MKIDIAVIEAILRRGNTVEIKKIKDKILILEVKKSIRTPS